MRLCVSGYWGILQKKKNIFKRLLFSSADAAFNRRAYLHVMQDFAEKSIFAFVFLNPIIKSLSSMGS